MRYSIVRLRREQQEAKAERARQAAENFRFACAAVAIIAAIILAFASGITWQSFT